MSRAKGKLESAEIGIRRESIGIFTDDAFLLHFQTEIAKRLNAIIVQLLPFLAQEVSL